MKLVPTKNNKIILNLGCGSNTHPEMNNIDYSIQSRLAKSKFLTYLIKKSGFLNEDREAFLSRYSENIILYNLAKGIPVQNNSVDVIYHSHLLEHLTPDDAANFIRSIFLKLRSGGKIRVVVPDLAIFCDNYLKSLRAVSVDGDSAENIEKHESNTYRLLQQMVITETANSLKNSKLRRKLENLVLGDRRKRGDLHLWMYDLCSLRLLLEKSGFISVTQVDHMTSAIDSWNYYGLDVNEDGSPYKMDSIYFEGEKP